MTPRPRRFAVFGERHDREDLREKVPPLPQGLAFTGDRVEDPAVRVEPVRQDEIHGVLATAASHSGRFSMSLYSRAITQPIRPWTHIGLSGHRMSPLRSRNVRVAAVLPVGGVVQPEGNRVIQERGLELLC